MTAEELTNQVLEMRNVAASLDIWLTFEALENGELGEHGGDGSGGCSQHGRAGEEEVRGTGGQLAAGGRGNGDWHREGNTVVRVSLPPQSGPCTPRRRCWSKLCSGASSQSPAPHTYW